MGLFTALCLAERGVRVEIIDKYHRAASHSYALALHPHTLRLLDRFGLAQKLIEKGNVVGRIGLHVEQTCRGELDLSALEGPFPFVLVLPQVLLEALLEQRLAEEGVEVLWNHPALAFEIDKGRVRTLVSRVQETEEIEATTFRMHTSFLIGTDGYDSLTRRLLGIGYADLGGQVTYGLFDFRSPVRQSHRVDLVFHDQTTDVLWPLGPERGRWNVQLGDYEQSCDLGRLQKLLRVRAPWFDSKIDEVHWVTTVKFERRLADRFGEGSVWLAGDAAHLTSPVGVQGMNVGLREAHELARHVASVVKDGSSPNRLLNYDTDRRNEWRRLLGLDGDLEMLPHAPDWVRSLARRLLPSFPASGDDLSRLLEQIGLRHVNRVKRPSKSDESRTGNP